MAFCGVLDPASGKWTNVESYGERFFQRLIGVSNDQLLIVGGSDMSTGFNKSTLLVSVSQSEADELDPGSKNTLEHQLADLKSAHPNDYESIIEKLLSQNVDRDRLMKLLKKNIPPGSPANLAKGWSAWKATDKNGVERPYQIYTPESVSEGAEPAAVVVHIHGAVARPEFGSGLGTAGSVGYAGFLWPKVAEKQNYLIVCPLGRSDCVWWSDNGTAHIQAVIRDLKRKIAVPERSIFCSGFSDGASGCYYLSMVAPEPFAGFIAMNGHPAVGASASGKQLYLRNMRQTPFLAAMTQNDSLYPTHSLLPHLNMAIKSGAPIWLVSYAKANHQPTYFNDQTTAIVNFINNNKLARTQDRIRWQTADTGVGKVRWMEIMEIGQAKTDVEPWDELNLMTEPGRVSLGVELDSFASLKLKNVVSQGAAEAAGVVAGDTILKIDDTQVSGARELRNVLSTYKFGQKFTCTVKRGEEEKTLNGKFPAFTPQQHYLRSAPTAQIDCKMIAGDDPRIEISSVNVQQVRIWLEPGFAKNDTVNVIFGSGEDKISQAFPVTRLSPKQLLETYADNPKSIHRDRYVDINM